MNIIVFILTGRMEGTHARRRSGTKNPNRYRISHQIHPIASGGNTRIRLDFRLNICMHTTTHYHSNDANIFFIKMKLAKSSATNRLSKYTLFK